MPQYPNIHAYLENEELHPPKDFAAAEEVTQLTKDANGEIAWAPQYWQAPVLGVADAMLAPPMAQHGDRYILSDLGTAVATSIDISADINGDADDAWDSATTNDIAQYFATDVAGEELEEWLPITPLEGYRVHNLDGNTEYYFDGTTWQQLAIGSPSTGVELMEMKFSISSASIQSLNSSPVQLIPAPGVGKAIEVISAIGAIDSYGGTPYDDHFVLSLKTDTAEDEQFFNTDLLASSAARRYRFEGYYNPSTTYSQFAENEALQLYCPTGDPATGNSDITLYLTYRIITL